MKISLYILSGGDKPAKADNPPPYDPTSDPGYRAANKLLKQLRPDFDKARHKMTMEEIIASLPEFQRRIIEAQKQDIGPTPSNVDWGAINKLRNQVPLSTVSPVFAPQYQGGMFNGPQQIDPSQLSSANQNFVYQASLLGQPNNGVKT